MSGRNLLDDHLVSVLNQVYANGILNIINQVPKSSIEQKKRWVYELIQNACDSIVNDESRDDVNIEIRITKVDKNTEEVNKGIVLEVTDKRLLEVAGGIVQGMSGSPIIQNGKLVGAVTHVFVQNAAKGYGIFIENMLESVGSS